MKKSLSLTIVLTVFFLLSASAWATPVPDTGQTKCYNDSQEIACPLPGEAFYGQDAQYIANPQSYTKLDVSGNTLPDSATEWVMIRDNVTDLIWENKTDDSSIHDKDNYYTWYDAQDIFIATLNTQNFGGHNDWRLPTEKELAALVNRNAYAPAINTTYFPNTVSTYYWTANTIANFPDNAWYVDFSEGGVNDYGKSYSYGVRAVRGGQCGPFGNFVDNGNGTITDTINGLMWQKDTAPDVYTWQQALSYCENLSLAEYDDWRLPSVSELQSLVDYGQYSPSIDTVSFPNTSLSYYWTSTSSGPHFPHYAWLITFDNGTVRADLKDLYDSVRAVRGGMRPVPDTGQTKCYDTTSEIQCPQPGESFYGQDAQYDKNVQSYTKLDVNGNDLPETATEWAMIRDNVTGLIWENKTDDGSIHDKDNIYNWQDAQDVFITTLNGGNFGGYNNWRLPTIKELTSIANRDTYSPAITTSYFPNVQLTQYWSSSPYQSNSSNAWVVNFYDGYVIEEGKSKNESYYVRAVRGEPYGSLNYYIDNGDGTVADITTGLMWQKHLVPGTHNWQQALFYCEGLTLAGYTDWRLSNVNELQSLVDYNLEYPSIDTEFFPATAAYYWSSTTWVHQPYVAWFVGFNHGSVGDGNKGGVAETPIRAVRTIGDYDTDCVGDVTDNCPVTSNTDQLDSYPPQGNSCGDACECEGNFDGDEDVDGSDAATFKKDFGRSKLQRPCTNEDPCNGDFSCDVDLDGTDASLFKSDFGRSSFIYPCPNCVTVPWCVYP